MCKFKIHSKMSKANAFTLHIAVCPDPGSPDIMAPPTVNKSTLSENNVSAQPFPVSFVTVSCGPAPGMSATFVSTKMDGRFETHTQCRKFGEKLDIDMTTSQLEMQKMNPWINADTLPDYEPVIASGAIALEAWCMHPTNTSEAVQESENPPMRIGKTVRLLDNVLAECAASYQNTTTFNIVNTNFADPSLAGDMLVLTVHMPFAKKHIQYLKTLREQQLIGDASKTIFDSGPVLTAARTEMLAKLVDLPTTPGPGDESRVAVEQMLNSCNLPAPECVQLSRHDKPVPNEIMTLTLDNLQRMPLQYTCGPLGLRFVAESICACNLGPKTLTALLTTIETDIAHENQNAEDREIKISAEQQTAYEHLAAISVAAMSMQMRSPNLAEYKSDIAPIGLDCKGTMVNTIAEDISHVATLAIDIDKHGQVCLRNDCEGLTHHAVHYVMQAVLKSSLELKKLSSNKQKETKYLCAAGIDTADDAHLAVRCVHAIAAATQHGRICFKPQLIVAGAPAATTESLAADCSSALHDQIAHARKKTLQLAHVRSRKSRCESTRTKGLTGSSGGHCCGLQLVGGKVYPAEFTAPVQWANTEARNYHTLFPEKSKDPVPTVNFAMAMLQGLPTIHGSSSRSEMTQIILEKGNQSDFYQRSSVTGDCIVAEKQSQNSDRVFLGRDMNLMQGTDTVFIYNSSDLMDKAQETARQRGLIVNTYITPSQSFQRLLDSFPKLINVCAPHTGSSDDGIFFSISKVYTASDNSFGQEKLSQEKLATCLTKLSDIATSQYSGAVFRVHPRLDGFAFQVCLRID